MSESKKDPAAILGDAIFICGDCPECGSDNWTEENGAGRCNACGAGFEPTIPSRMRQASEALNALLTARASDAARIADLEAMLREAGNALVKSPCVHGASSPEACAVAERVMFGHAKCLRCRALTKLDQSGLLPKVQP